MKFTAKKINVTLNGGVLQIDLYAFKEPIFKTIDIPITLTKDSTMYSQNKPGIDMEKDYSLLRPFDLEAANNKAPICWPCRGVEIMFVGMASDNKAVIEYFAERQVQKVWPTDLRMAPLAWVEGRPVYKLDVLYNRLNDNKVVFDHMCASCNVESTFTWQKPKTKREGWINMYRNRHGLMPNVQLDNGKPFKSYDNAMQNGIHDDYIGAIKIEWEE